MTVLSVNSSPISVLVESHPPCRHVILMTKFPHSFCLFQELVTLSFCHSDQLSHFCSYSTFPDFQYHSRVPQQSSVLSSVFFI